MAAIIALPPTYSFSDAVAFGRVSERVIAYLDRVIDDVPAEPKTPGAVERVFVWVSARVNAYITVARLAALPDRLLDDAGLTRADLRTELFR